MPLILGTAETSELDGKDESDDALPSGVVNASNHNAERQKVCANDLPRLAKGRTIKKGKANIELEPLKLETDDA